MSEPVARFVIPGVGTLTGYTGNPDDEELARIVANRAAAAGCDCEPEIALGPADAVPRRCECRHDEGCGIYDVTKP